MSTASRGSAAAARISGRGRPKVCASCRSSQLFRAYSAAAQAAVQAESHALKPTEPTPHPPVTTSRRLQYRIKSGIILTRAPLLTRTLTPFENAFFFYQKRLNERLAIPFRHTLFFKKNTAGELDWKLKFKERGKLNAKELGRYYAKGRNAWNDELLVGSTLSDEQRLRDTLIKDAEVRVTEDGEEAKPDEIVPVERPMDRTTEADKTNDVTRLDRKLDRTLYLVIRTGSGKWQFPADLVASDENLHLAARRVLDQSAGHNMNTWIVGRVPVAHYVERPRFSAEGAMLERGQKVFLLKGRIFAGQANLTGNPFGYTDFSWLTREELKDRFRPPYYRAVKNMMADR